MSYEHEHIVNCSEFEELITDYLDKTLDGKTHKAVAEHAMKCPLCHTLLNEVKESLVICREMAAPSMPLTRLEARVLSMTVPQSAMNCEEFEGYLTDYMDGFLPATLFHRWERHAVLCNSCTDLPGMVVRSIAACYTYKMEELAVPAGLHQKILNATLGTARAAEVKASWASQFGEWVRSLRFPIPVPQLASVAMMALFAFLIFTQTVSADGSITGFYQKSVELAEQTYQQSADAWNGKAAEPAATREPVTGTTYTGQEESK